MKNCLFAVLKNVKEAVATIDRVTPSHPVNVQTTNTLILKRI